MPVLKELTDKVNSKQREVEILVEEIFERMNRSEVEVRNAWDAFGGIISRNIMQKNEVRVNGRSASHTRLAQKKYVLSQSIGFDDGWLSLLSYHIAVHRQEQIFKHSKEALGRVYEKVALIN